MQLKIIKIIAIVFLIIIGPSVVSQVKIGDPNSPDANSILDLTNSSNLGLLLNNRLTSVDTSDIQPVGTLQFYDGELYLSQSSSIAKWNALSPWRFNGSYDYGVCIPSLGTYGVGIGVNTHAASYQDSTYLHLAQPNTSKNIIDAPLLIGPEIGTQTPPPTDKYMLVNNKGILCYDTDISNVDTLFLQQIEYGKVQVGESSSNNTDLNVYGKVTEGGGNIQPKNAIIMWNGNITGSNFNSGLGINEMTGWAICDGNNGTPDLTGRFIVGSGERNKYIRTASGSIDSLSANETFPVPAQTSIGGQDDFLQTASQVGIHLHTKGTLSAISRGAHEHGSKASSVYGGGSIGACWPEDDGVNLGPRDVTTSTPYLQNVVANLLDDTNTPNHSHDITGTTLANASSTPTAPQEVIVNHPYYYVVIYLMKL